MKNATKHAETLKSLSKRLAKEHKPVPKKALDPLTALVRGAMTFDVPESKVDEIMGHIDREFVDFNELRVATDLEIQELLGAKYPQIEKRVTMITQSLNNIFEREHTLNLERMKEISRRDARAFLHALPEIHPFVVAYVMLFAFDGAAVPVDEAMLAVLREEEVVDETTGLEDAQKFLEHHVKADECHDFYVALRSAASGKKKGK